MSVILILILASLGLAVVFLTAFVWAVCDGQYEDTCTPSMRVLLDAEDRAPAIAGNAVLMNTSLQRGESKPVEDKPALAFSIVTKKALNPTEGNSI